MIFAIALTGPTASGKTGLSLDIAKHFDVEIISLDSMQIYRGMDIGTAKATKEEREAVRHHMLDVVEPTESFSAEDYRVAAIRAMEDITARGKTPLFVGGTGLYLDTLMRGTAPLSPPSSPELRDRMYAEAQTEEGRERLWQRLLAVDPESAEKTHKNNVRRVVRALEIFELTGMTKTYFDMMSKSEAGDVDILHLTLDFSDRELLYNRVDLRVDEMMGAGLLHEVRSLYEDGRLPPDSTAAQAIGYKEIISHLRGEISLDDAVELIKLSSRRYAKRQLTWFRHNAEAKRITVDKDGKMLPREQLVSTVYEIISHEITKRQG